MSFLYTSIFILYIYIHTSDYEFFDPRADITDRLSNLRSNMWCNTSRPAGRTPHPQHTSRFSPSPSRALRPHTASAFPFRTHISSHSSVYSQQMWCRTATSRHYLPLPVATDDPRRHMIMDITERLDLAPQSTARG